VKNLERLNRDFSLDFVDSFLFEDDKHFTFYFDFQETHRTFYIMSNKQSFFKGLRQDSFHFEEIVPYILRENELSEVEGKMTFIEDIKKKIDALTEESHIFLPIKDEDGRLFWLTVGFYVKTYQNGRPRLVFGRVNRVQRETPDEIRFYQLAHQDPATKLFTRETLRKHIEMQEGFDGRYGLYIDIDGFKSINDTHGHKIGDLFLEELANVFIQDWEKDVIYYRLGGDEFFVRVNNHTKEQVEKRAKDLVKTIEAIALPGYPIDVSASIGIVKIDEHLHLYEEILDASDKAMYQAKDNKTKRHQFYED
jgi:diguanylate cyclase (GGDEF)-like protein